MERGRSDVLGPQMAKRRHRASISMQHKHGVRGEGRSAIKTVENNTWKCFNNLSAVFFRLRGVDG